MDAGRSTLALLLTGMGLFALAFIGTGLAGFAIHVLSRPRWDAMLESGVANLAMAGYLILVTGLSAAVGFTLVTTASRAWRDLRFRRLVLLSLFAGALCYGAYLVGLAHALMYFAVPSGLGRFGVVLRLLVPGLVVGLMALGIMHVLRMARIPAA